MTAVRGCFIPVRLCPARSDRLQLAGFLAGGQDFGAEQFCAIRSYLATTAKHGIGLLDALTQLTNQRPWLPAAI